MRSFALPAFCSAIMFTAFVEGVMNRARPQARRNADDIRRPEAGTRNESSTISEKLLLGAKAFAFLRNISQEAADSYAQALAARDGPALDDDGDGVPGRAPSLPYGFWNDFWSVEMRLTYNEQRRTKGRRALQLYLQRQAAGARTAEAERGGAKPTAKRNSSAASNATKALGLGHMLLQFFVDEVRFLSCRADSSLLMDKARSLRQTLLDQGWAECDVPRLEGQAGKSWFRRWRLGNHIAARMTGM